ncbi:hypothetical protein [Pseudomonas phage vB_Pae_CF57a]|nr:hypothetical protein [Pseudomonas phage vB_Pae_CF57a]
MIMTWPALAATSVASLGASTNDALHPPAQAQDMRKPNL